MAESKERDLHPAEIARAEAEGRKADAEAEAARANAAKANAEARLSIAQAAEAELKLVSAQHDADRAEEKRKKELSTDEHHHTYHFSGQVDTTSAQKCMDQLNYWRRNEKPGKIELIFYSPGGSVLAGMALFDHVTAMRSEGWYFTSVCRGFAASMAGILLECADYRVMGKESYVLIHEISTAAIGKIGELEDEVDFCKMVQNRVWDIFVRRSNGKLTKAKIQSLVRRKDAWFDSDRCLKLGLVDAVVDA